MSEFFHNLSMQALSREGDRIKIKSDAITELGKSKKDLIREDDRHDITFIDFRPKQFEEIKDPNLLFVENVVENIISGIGKILTIFFPKYRARNSRRK